MGTRASFAAVAADRIFGGDGDDDVRGDARWSELVRGEGGDDWG